MGGLRRLGDRPEARGQIARPGQADRGRGQGGARGRHDAGVRPEDTRRRDEAGVEVRGRRNRARGPDRARCRKQWRGWHRWDRAGGWLDRRGPQAGRRTDPGRRARRKGPGEGGFGPRDRLHGGRGPRVQAEVLAPLEGHRPGVEGPRLATEQLVPRASGAERCEPARPGAAPRLGSDHHDRRVARLVHRAVRYRR